MPRRNFCSSDFSISARKDYLNWCGTRCFFEDFRFWAKLSETVGNCQKLSETVGKDRCTQGMILWPPGTLRSWELVRASVTTTQTRPVLRFPQVLWSRADFVQFSDSFRQFRTVSDSFRQFWRAEPQPRRNEECSKYCRYIDLTPTRLCARDHDVHRRLGITQYNCAAGAI